MGSTIQDMASAIHTTTLTMINSEMASNDWSLEETIGAVGFPMYFAFDKTGNLAVIGCPFPIIPIENHQEILADVRKQLIDNGFDFFAFATQNCIMAIESTEDRHWESHSAEEISKGKRMIATQICDIDSNEKALITDFQGENGGFIEDNESVKGQAPNHILWASATGCPVTWEQLNSAQGE